MSAVAYENVRLRECVKTEFVWEFKRGFVKAVVSRAVRLQECPLSRARNGVLEWGGGGGGWAGLKRTRWHETTREVRGHATPEKF